MIKYLTLAILFVSSVSMAAGGGEHEGVPLDKIGWQAANLGILLVAIFFLIRKSVVATFTNRQKDFLEQSEKTKASLREAEGALKEIKIRLSELESGEKASFERAQKEASVLLANIVKEAESQAAKAKADAKMMIQTEALKAKNEISNMIFDAALKATSQELSGQSKKISNDSESSFVKQISQVTT